MNNETSSPSSFFRKIGPAATGLLLTAALLAGCATAPSGSDAAFYAYSGAVPDTPGTLLRSEPLPAKLGLEAAARQYRILYTSTNGRTGSGQLVTSGAVFYPKGPAPTGGWPIVAWAHGTVGVADICAPSRNVRSKRDADYLDAWLRQGFAVVATDYQGLGTSRTSGPHLYLNTRAESYAALDSVRAVLGGMKDVANRVIILGQSQGGGAAFATAGYASAYAPDLKVLGTGVADRDVSTAQQLRLAKDACAAGTLVQQHVYPGLSHSETVNASLADSIPFVRSLLAGQPVASTCASGPL